MIAFALTNWRWLVPTAMAAFCAMMWGWTEVQYSTLKTEVAEAAVRASEHARSIEDRYRQIAADAERQHHEDQARTTALYDVNRKLVADGVRFKARCGRLSEGTRAPGDTPNGTAEVRLPDAFVSDLLALARDADGSADYARAGHNWAVKIGAK